MIFAPINNLNSLIFAPSFETKKSVLGISQHTASIPGVSIITSLDDLLNENFNVAYDQFSTYLDEETYNGINSELDLIMRFAPNLFSVTSMGTIISDFPEHTDEGIRMLSRLRFIQLALAKYLGVSHTEQPHFIQVLCEDHRSLSNADKLFKTILHNIQSIIEKNPQNIDSALQLFFPDNKFIFQPFFGPSDTTTKFGSLAKVLILKQMLNVRKLFIDFKSTINRADLTLDFGNGRGNGIGRSSISILPVNHITFQGTSYSTEFRSSVLESMYMNLLLNNHLADFENPEYLDDFVTRINTLSNALQFGDYGQSPYIAHWGDFDNGMFVNEYNRLVKQDDSLLSRIATKDISGTSGSRGSEGKSFSVLSFKNQRAIGKDMLKYTTGLPRLMGLDFSQVGKEPILELLKTTWGADLILSELIDFLQTSPMRSASLQISDQAIKSGINYHRNSIIKLAQALGKPFSLNTNSTKKQRLKIAMYILQQWRMLLSEDRNQTSILLSNRLDAYNAIMNQINELNAMTDHMIENIVARGVTEADINLLQSLSALIWVNVDLGLPNIPNF